MQCSPDVATGEVTLNGGLLHMATLLVSPDSRSSYSD